MSQRLKVLISAYACEPGKGSEPEVGWQWALQMARHHDVTVLTRANNRQAIEPAIEALRGRQPLPLFIYHDRSLLLLEFKRRAKAVKLYYLLWQRSARDVVARLHEIHQYDLMHHVTFAGFRYPVAIWGHGAPCIWGPVGGIESIPFALLPWHHPASLRYEVFRNANNLLQAAPFHVLPKRARATTLILVSTREMKETFAKLGFESEVMPTIGLNPAELPFHPHRQTSGPLRLLFVGNVVTLKGIDLALAALGQSQTDATLTVIGTGNYLEAAKREVVRLGLGERVKFQGRIPREEVLKIYGGFDVFLFPSLHDTGGYAVIEAMFNELPVICLDCGGPAVIVKEGCGLKVALGGRAEVITNLATSIRWYDQNRAALAEHGKAARDVILGEFDWQKKGTQMDDRYREAVRRSQTQAKQPNSNVGYSGMGGFARLVHHIFSIGGLTLAGLALVLIAGLGFLSIGHLKEQAGAIVRDTLPGLSMAGEANASMTQGFNRMLLLLVTDNPDERARLRREIDSFSQATSSYLASYAGAVYEKEDQALFEALKQRRHAYLQVRERALDLIDRQQSQEALGLYERELLSTYQRYKEAGDRLFEYNMRQGKERGQAIMRVCTATQWVVAGIGVVIFILGFVIGMFK